MKKIVLIIIISSLIFSSSGVFNRPAKAIFGIGDIVFDPTHTVATIGGWAKDALLWIKDHWLEMLRDVIVKRILDMMVDDIVQWIQGGGEPGFVTDFGGFMEDAFQAGVGDVIKQTNMAWLCSPFKAQLQLSVSYLPVQKFSQRIECTLDDIVANIEDFYANFENGGWIAYNEIWKPQNNFYGAILMTHDEMMIQGAKKQKAAENEVLAGAGFLSQKKCEQKDEQEIYDCLAAFSPTGNPEDTDASDKEYCESQATCLKEKIVTPGDTVAQGIADAMGSDFRYMEGAKTYMAAIINAVINRLFSEGLALMKGSDSEGTSYDYSDTDYADTVDQDLETTKNEIKKEYEDFLGEKQYILNAKNQSLSSAEQTLQILQNIKNNCSSCSPQPSDTEIQTVQSEIDRLRAEIAGLQLIITELDGLIAEINNISPENRDREMALVFQHRDEFESKYDINQLYIDIYTGDKRNAADQEKNDKQNELTAAQNRLNTCNTLNTCSI